MREKEFSVKKCTGPFVICSKFNFWHKSLTFPLKLSFRISTLKSTVIKILEIMVSRLSPIESSVDVKIACVDLGSLKKVPMSCILFLI